LLVILRGLLGWRSLTELRAARLFERAEPAVGNRLSNAVQLAAQTGASPVEEFLRREAIELARDTAATLKTWASCVAPCSWPRRAWEQSRWVGCAVPLWAAMCFERSCPGSLTAR